jgi:hypothetical protein
MELLCGWKEISSYLHLTVRSAQRWEKAGLPVHRAYESRRSPVVASVQELDSWLRRKTTRARTHVSVLQPVLAAELEEAKSERRRVRRTTRRLLSSLSSLRTEHRRLLGLIKSNLTTHILSSVYDHQ